MTDCRNLLRPLDVHFLDKPYAYSQGGGIKYWIFKRRILDFTNTKVKDARAALAMVLLILREETFDDLQIYGDTMAIIIDETSDKLGISKKEAIYADALTWRKLNVAEDDFRAATHQALNKEQENKAATQAVDQSMGLCCNLLMLNYMLRSVQQRLPEVLPKEVSQLYRFGVNLVDLLYELGKRDISSHEFSDWLMDHGDDPALSH